METTLWGKNEQRLEKYFVFDHFINTYFVACCFGSTHRTTQIEADQSYFQRQFQWHIQQQTTNKYKQQTNDPNDHLNGSAFCK